MGTISYLLYVYCLDCVCLEYGNCIIFTVCLLSRLCVSEIRELYHTNNVRLIETFWQRNIKGIVFLYDIVEIEEIASYMKSFGWWVLFV